MKSSIRSRIVRLVMGSFLGRRLFVGEAKPMVVHVFFQSAVDTKPLVGIHIGSRSAFLKKR